MQKNFFLSLTLSEALSCEQYGEWNLKVALVVTHKFSCKVTRQLSKKNIKPPQKLVTLCSYSESRKLSTYPPHKIP
jgi:hypothetical protein